MNACYPNQLLIPAECLKVSWGRQGFISENIKGGGGGGGGGELNTAQ